MPIEIVPYSEDLIGAVKAFNARLKAGGVSFAFPENHVPGWLPKTASGKIYQEYFLAVDDGLVVGGYILKHQEFSFKGDIRSMATFQFPLSEGIVNKTYSLVGLLALNDALRRQPLIFSPGMGSYEEPFPKLLQAMSWSTYPLPFYFKVNRPFRFFRSIAYLRKTVLRRTLLDLLAATGAGWVGVRLLQNISKRPHIRKNPAVVEKVSDFSHWADELWNVCKGNYSMIAVRDSRTLNILYPYKRSVGHNGVFRESGSFIRLKVLQGDQVIGWAVVLDTQMQNHRYFGNMRVGSIVDCLASPENASRVTQVATRFLEARGVDLIVSNQSHSSWCSALRDSGYIRGPSNFIFAASKKLSELLGPLEVVKTEIHINRGDGDGPINL